LTREVVFRDSVLFNGDLGFSLLYLSD